MEDVKLLGSVFGLDYSAHGTAPSFLTSDCTFFLNARSAMLAVFNALRPPTVWMPSFLCESMLDSPRSAGVPVRYFPVDLGLEIVIGPWIDQLRKGDVVVAIDYFGFQASQSIYETVTARGAYLLEDASQALLSKFVGTNSDFVVFSPRKFVGVPDGGILRGSIKCCEGANRLAPPESWWNKALGACLLRRDYDRSTTSTGREWFTLFNEMEAGMPIGDYSASSLSIAALKTAIEWESVKTIRRRNYLALLEGLKDYALFKVLPDDVVPLGFPIVTKHRDELRQRLFAGNIYPPIHWKLSDAVPPVFSDSHRLSRSILTLICDQRYDVEDMANTVRVVRQFLGG